MAGYSGSPHMRETEHVYPTIGFDVEGVSSPVLTGYARERVVRCRDCRFADPAAADAPIGQERDCQLFGHATDGSGFCKWAEERTEERQ